MKLLKIDFIEIQKAMEDVSRDAFDYFLDLETGEVMTISNEMLEKAEANLYKSDNEPITNEKEIDEYDMPEWIEKEVEMAVRIFSSEKDSYVRIPERESSDAYNLMKKFTEGVEELHPHDELLSALGSPNAFSRFKKALSDFPSYREKWFALNARAMKKTISEWLTSIGVKPEQVYH
ncbi:MAG: UPF0158 family protein [Thermodesulfovibrionales bacterium]|nr:UPF0158 family protein [Thermodesulfovibrionales bacterium]